MLPSVDEDATLVAPAHACCSCRCDRATRTDTSCYWCQLHAHLDHCVAMIARGL